MGTFARTYERWVLRRPAFLERKLLRSYRSAWSSGDSEDRSIVLDFILLADPAGGIDIVAAAVVEADEALAGAAASTASVMIGKGYDLGPTIESDLEQFAQRYPSWSTVAKVALRRLRSRSS